MEKLGLSKGQFDSRKRNLLDPYDRKLPHSGLSLQKALYQFLPLSCLLIIFAFSARREHEVFGLTTKSFKQDGSCWRVKFYVGKTDREEDWFVHTSLVGKALKTLERLSAGGRCESDSDSLFRFNDTFERAPVNMDRLTRSIDSFQDFIGVECDENGERFKFSEHQFRRFFAIMFFYRYEKGGDAEALMHELRHADWSMTQIYLTERETGRIFREVEQEYIARKLAMSIEDGGISGPIAAEFKDKLLSNGGINVVPEKRKELAMSVVEVGQLTLEFISEGLCLGHSPGRKQLSSCFSDGHVMCHKASASLCEGCPNLFSVDDIKNDISSEVIQGDDYGDSIILNAVVGEQ
ncbi:site-specific integrase [Dasania sp. GY-MA-18]|uniref:Site-specific integrase n=2 Tax=Spongiibacteraceae TaxID=1706375 RepID=A0A9J6RNZ2_9GAMM|nr:site-specific integrase [Dasania sp. GY-MA-18]MCR8923471.1 site-specific integrase [Dasania sp. GY-MA-18]MCZ0865904.1 site-specific integrase [Dasania phycosphaerae]MCZ0869628.1 site-specific integrase [Dasania phycosphaerae]